MRKSTKIAVVLAAAALLVAGFAFTTLAKGWVKEAEGLYYYEDAEGMKVYNEWKKDPDPNTGEVKFYYLGDDGYMVTNTLVETDGKFYWCGADGAKVINQWVQVPADDEDKDAYDVEYRWYRFDSKGQAICGKKATVEGESYFFNNDGKMLFGYVSYAKDTEPQMKKSIESADDGDSYNYYCGTNDEGKALKSAWRKEVVDTSKSTYEDSESFWTYFKSSGEKATSAEPNGILYQGARYYFDANGTMLTGWQTGTDSTVDTATSAFYYGGADDGKKVKKAWAYVKPDGASADDKFWFYFNNVGEAVKKSGVEKINGKFYAFDEPVKQASKMLAGTVELEFADGAVNPFVTDAISATKVKVGDYTLADWLDENFEAVYYFSGDEANDGSLKKNVSFQAELKDDTYSLAVGSDGSLKNYYDSKAKKYYKNGYLLKADEEMRYQMVNVWTSATATVKTLLTTSGSEVASGTVTDADGNYYYVVKATTEEPKKIYRADSSLLSAAKAVSAFKNNTTTTIDGIKYDAYADASEFAKNGYINIKLRKHVD